MIVALLVLLSIISRNLADENKSFKIYRTIPKNQEELQRLYDYWKRALNSYDFWTVPSVTNGSVDIMVRPDQSNEFLTETTALNLPFKVVVDDLAKMIEKYEGRSIWEKFDSQKRLNDDRSLRHTGIRLGEYYSYNEIVNWMNKLQQRYPNLVKVLHLGTTHQKRDIIGVQLGTRHDGRARVVWISAGMHAREWASIHTAMYIIDALILGYDHDPEITDILDNLEIQVYPCINPDGYEFTRSSPSDPLVRLWRKNLSPEHCGEMVKGKKKLCCEGVDLNRNFDYNFAQVGTSHEPCAETYHGPAPFSEPETRAMRDAIMKLRHRLDAVIDLHTYSQLWVYPFSDKKGTYSDDVEDLKALARKAVTALAKPYGTIYRYGTGPDMIYAYAGGSTDWAKKVAKIKYTYTIELPPNAYAWNGFVMNKRHLIPTGKETFEGVKIVLLKILENFAAKNEIIHRTTTTKAPPDLGPCEDANHSCQYWIRRNPKVCKIAKSKMEIECRLTCEFCHPPSNETLTDDA
ncbi:hypothetical protein AB6A40_000118 [Gnathostoma spinigerum]|uniref:Carboxypeptidase B n=1 Tax=Gnathostoma spinigerum TaxID=75299 RepID=A0ABD6E1F5_9BILA